MVTTTISETTFEGEHGERSQYRTTVPKQLVEAFDLANATVEWEVESSTALTIRVVDD